MEITTTIVTVAAFSAGIASITYAISLIIALIRGREPKVVSRMAIRRQLHNTYLDVDFNITDKDNDESVVQKIVDHIDQSGVAFEKIKSDFEADQERKRQATPPAYQDPGAAQTAIADDNKKKKKKKKKRNR
jgi:hypothetical protein